MAMIRPLFPYYGAKWRIAPMYPQPTHSTIVEPFAGSAAYSLRMAGDRRVMLFDTDPNIVKTWRYLLSVTPEEILGLPDIGADQTVDDLEVSEDARRLIGWWLNAATMSPNRAPSAWMRQYLGKSASWVIGEGSALFWGPRVRARISGALPRLRNWTIEQAPYNAAPDIDAHWFIDPPYQVAGRYYRHGSSRIDYATLGGWTQTRRGTVIACENAGAEWLPFRPMTSAHAASSRGVAKRSAEVVWTSGAEFQGSLGVA